MSTFSGFDHACMSRALRLAERGLYTTHPNPRVGCVIARDGEVIGEGFHQRAGGPHAEVFALREAGERAVGATAYVTLEPCAHHGRTPPCADALIAARVKRVVAAVRDPFAAVDGQGLQRLRDAGIEVQTGLMEQAARELNIGFFSRIERGRPWLRLKLAMSLDGRTALATGESKWITGAAAREDVQQWRARAGAILSSSATVRRDDPRLTVRLREALSPAPRIIVCGGQGAPLDASLFSDGLAPVWLAGSPGSLPPPGPGIELIELPMAEQGVDLAALLRALGERGVNELHGECGARLSGALLRAGLVDEMLIYQAPLLLGSGARPLFDDIDLSSMSERYKLRLLDVRHLGEDLRLQFRPATTEQGVH